MRAGLSWTRASLPSLLIMRFDEIGRKGIGKTRSKYRLEEVSVGGQEIYADGKLFNLPLGKGLDDFAGGMRPGEICRIDFLTPVQLRAEAGIADPSNFKILFDSIFRRIKLLARFHSSERLKENKTLKEDALRVVAVENDVKQVTIERLSRSQGRFLKYIGYIGRVSFVSIAPEMVPWLQIGEYLHVGHGCTFGLGRYQISAGNT